MNFSNIKEITIPEGPVRKIHAGNALLWSRSLIPSIYQQVEYIATDGNQYIDTGVTASDHPNGLNYKWHGRGLQRLSDSNNWIFGALAGGTRSGNLTYVDASFRLFIGSYSGHIIRSDAIEYTNRDNEVILTNITPTAPSLANGFINDIPMIKLSNGTVSTMPNANIYLFRCNGASTGSWFCGRLYSFTMDHTDGRPIRNFVPCYRISDGEIGLYDTVEGGFYTNQGSGSFSKGPDVSL